MILIERPPIVVDSFPEKLRGKNPVANFVFRRICTVVEPITAEFTKFKEKYIRIIDLGGQRLMMQGGRLPTDEEEDEDSGKEGGEEADGEAEEEAEEEGDEAHTPQEEGEEEAPVDKGRGKRGRKNRDQPEHDEGAKKPLKKRAKA